MNRLKPERSSGFNMKAFFSTFVMLLAIFFAFSTLQAQTAAKPLNGAVVDLAIGVDGDFAVVGAWWHDNFSGAAYIWQRVNGQWVEQQKLSPADLGAYDHFGLSVTIQGDEVLIGAPWQDVFRGAVYVFKRDPSSQKWVEQNKLVDNQGQPDDQFGRQVKLANELATIATRTNGAYEILRRGNIWDAQQKVAASDFSPDASVSVNLQASGILDAIAKSDYSADKPSISAAAPDPVSSVTATDGTYEDRVEIRWSPVSEDAIIYKIRRGANLLSVASSEDSLFSDVGGDPGTVYTYSVVVVDMADMESDPETDEGSRIIFAPEQVDASDGVFTDRVRISWIDRSEVEAGYIIERGGSPLDTTAANVDTYDDSTATSLSPVTYTVKALDANVCRVQMQVFLPWF